MKVLKNTDVLIKAINNVSNLGFVPTMGGLHQGHVSLIKKSQIKCQKTLVSIYVNPKQFNNRKDFLNYPKNISKDLNLLKKLEVDYVFIPKTKEIYKKKRLTKITLLKSQKILCAKYRKGHFEGVLDIMERFIKLIKPKYIFMGEKDYQQIFLLKKFIKGKYKCQIFACKTLRHKNKIALSTRNFLLSKNELRKAASITNFLKKIKYETKINRSINKSLQILKNKLIKKFDIKIEYLEFRSEINLKEIFTDKKCRLFISYYIGKVRLIDNF